MNILIPIITFLLTLRLFMSLLGIPVPKLSLSWIPTILFKGVLTATTAIIQAFAKFFTYRPRK